MKKRLTAALVPLFLVASACSSGPGPIRVGAVYPTGGGQGMGGGEELRGVRLAAEWINAHGGVDGRPVELMLEPADSSDAAPRAVERVVDGGAPVVLGSYGSTISAPAAQTAARLGAVFWETGAVGDVERLAAPGDRFFRVVQSGESLGRIGVWFIQHKLLPRLGMANPRFGVTYVDDVYGRAVARGARREIRDSALRFGGMFPYRLDDVSYEQLSRRIARAHIDVLAVSAYIEDGIALRRAMVRSGVPLVASVGTSSSYCMPEFGETLGKQAVGLFASDKPDAEYLNPDALSPEAGEVLEWADTRYERRFGEEMPAAAVSGFAGAWALFRHVLPRASELTPAGIAAAARTIRLPMGSLPNGSGLRFAPAGSLRAGDNVRAASVIWEWIRPGVRAVVWPPAFADSPIVPIDLSRAAG